jgi:hypothetical protein
LEFIRDLYKGMSESTGRSSHPGVLRLALGSNAPLIITLEPFIPHPTNGQSREPILLLAAQSVVDGPPQSRTVATYASLPHGTMIRVVHAPPGDTFLFHVLCKDPDQGKLILVALRSHEGVLSVVATNHEAIARSAYHHSIDWNTFSIALIFPVAEFRNAGSHGWIDTKRYSPADLVTTPQGETIHLSVRFAAAEARASRLLFAATEGDPTIMELTSGSAVVPAALVTTSTLIRCFP